jgi:hypothetical protein
LFKKHTGISQLSEPEVIGDEADQCPKESQYRNQEKDRYGKSNTFLVQKITPSEFGRLLPAGLKVAAASS